MKKNDTVETRRVSRIKRYPCEVDYYKHWILFFLFQAIFSVIHFTRKKSDSIHLPLKGSIAKL